jgi:curli biogenesis system outer membrane secretion channel CsgG
MMLRKFSVLGSALLLIAGLVLPTASYGSAKRRIAVLPFSYGAAISHGVATRDISRSIADMLITRLVQDGTYTVIDRETLDGLLKEQNLSVSDRADPASAAKIGKLLSVDVVCTGVIDEFGFENHEKHVGVGTVSTGYIPYVGGIGGLGFRGGSHRSGKVHVALDAKVVDVNTGEVLAAAHASGDSARSSTDIFGSGGGSDDFSSSIAGEATAAAVDDLGKQIVAAAEKVPDNQANVTGKVADVTGTEVITNVGSNNGISVGDNLAVDKVVKTVKDPSTGAVLKTVTNTVAIVKVKSVDKSSSTGDIVKGNGVKVGDDVHKVTTDVAAIVIAPASSSINVTGAVLQKKPTKGK